MNREEILATAGLDITSTANTYAVDTFTGNPIEYASNHVTANCNATVVNYILYIITSGTCDVGVEVIA